MTRDKVFVLLVQTGAILQELTSRMVGKTDDAFRDVDALDVVGAATSLGEYEVPADVVTAAREFLDWSYGTADRPGWLPDRIGRPGLWP